MKNKILVLLLFFLLTGCSQPDSGVPVIEQLEPTLPAVEQRPTAVIMVPTATTMPVCLGMDHSQIGEGIAQQFENTDYDEVMSWFCEGAAYEDILVALQTEKLTTYPADEMLAMLADGMSWEEIWDVTGLTTEE